MPYRIDPTDSRAVQVQRGGHWRLLKRHGSAGDARAHVTALNINVQHVPRARHDKSAKRHQDNRRNRQRPYTKRKSAQKRTARLIRLTVAAVKLLRAARGQADHKSVGGAGYTLKIDQAISALEDVLIGVRQTKE